MRMIRNQKFEIMMTVRLELNHLPFGGRVEEIPIFPGAKN